MSRCVLCLFVSLALPSAFAGSRFDQITKDLPKDAVSIVERMVACKYWRAEMPDEKEITPEMRASERIEMIEDELQKAKCATFDADLKKAKSKYAKNKAVLDALIEAQSLTPAD